MSAPGTLKIFLGDFRLHVIGLKKDFLLQHLTAPPFLLESMFSHSGDPAFLYKLLYGLKGHTSFAKSFSEFEVPHIVLPELEKVLKESIPPSRKGGEFSWQLSFEPSMEEAIIISKVIVPHDINTLNGFAGTIPGFPAVPTHWGTFFRLNFEGKTLYQGCLMLDYSCTVPSPRLIWPPSDAKKSLPTLKAPLLPSRLRPFSDQLTYRMSTLRSLAHQGHVESFPKTLRYGNKETVIWIRDHGSGELIRSVPYDTEINLSIRAKDGAITELEFPLSTRVHLPLEEMAKFETEEDPGEQSSVSNLPNLPVWIVSSSENVLWIIPSMDVPQVKELAWRPNEDKLAGLNEFLFQLTTKDRHVIPLSSRGPMTLRQFQGVLERASANIESVNDRRAHLQKALVKEVLSSEIRSWDADHFYRIEVEIIYFKFQGLDFAALFPREIFLRRFWHGSPVRACDETILPIGNQFVARLDQKTIHPDQISWCPDPVRDMVQTLRTNPGYNVFGVLDEELALSPTSLTNHSIDVIFSGFFALPSDNQYMFDILDLMLCQSIDRKLADDNRGNLKTMLFTECEDTMIRMLECFDHRAIGRPFKRFSQQNSPRTLHLFVSWKHSLNKDLKLSFGLTFSEDEVTWFGELEWGGTRVSRGRPRSGQKYSIDLDAWKELISERAGSIAESSSEAEMKRFTSNSNALTIKKLLFDHPDVNLPLEKMIRGQIFRETTQTDSQDRLMHLFGKRPLEKLASRYHTIAALSTLFPKSIRLGEDTSSRIMLRAFTSVFFEGISIAPKTMGELLNFICFSKLIEKEPGLVTGLTGELGSETLKKIKNDARVRAEEAGIDPKDATIRASGCHLNELPELAGRLSRYAADELGTVILFLPGLGWICLFNGTDQRTTLLEFDVMDGAVLIKTIKERGAKRVVEELNGTQMGFSIPKEVFFWGHENVPVKSVEDLIENDGPWLDEALEKRFQSLKSKSEINLPNLGGFGVKALLERSEISSKMIYEGRVLFRSTSDIEEKTLAEAPILDFDTLRQEFQKTPSSSKYNLQNLFIPLWVRTTNHIFFMDHEGAFGKPSRLWWMLNTDTENLTGPFQLENIRNPDNGKVIVHGCDFSPKDAQP